MSRQHLCCLSDRKRGFLKVQEVYLCLGLVVYDILELPTNPLGVRAMAKQKQLQNATSEHGMLHSPSVPQKTKELWFVDGETYAKSGQYKEALAAFKRVLLLDPNSADAYVNKGTMLYYLKYYQEALTDFEQALRLQPQCGPAFYGKGCIFYQLGLRKKAFAAFEQAVHSDPTVALFHVNKGFLLWTFRHYTDAFAAYEQATELDENMATAYMSKGNIAFYSLNWIEEALLAYHRVTQLAPRFVSAYAAKGSVLLRLRRYQEAIDTYEQAIKIAPHDTTIQQGRTKALARLPHRGSSQS